MDQTAIEQRLNQVFQEVFGNDDLQVQDNTTPADVAGWDSLAHMRLILGIEREFKVKFTTRELAMLNSVGSVKDVLRSKGVS